MSKNTIYHATKSDGSSVRLSEFHGIYSVYVGMHCVLTADNLATAYTEYNRQLAEDMSK